MSTATRTPTRSRTKRITLTTPLADLIESDVTIRACGSEVWTIIYALRAYAESTEVIPATRSVAAEMAEALRDQKIAESERR